LTKDAEAKPVSSVQPLGRTPSATDADLRRFGITAHEHTIYEWNGYRYSNAADAIAAAKRGAT
jgi:hypothetical protein